jgi:hypothetical protein
MHAYPDLPFDECVGGIICQKRRRINAETFPGSSSAGSLPEIGINALPYFAIWPVLAAMYPPMTGFTHGRFLPPVPSCKSDCRHVEIFTFFMILILAGYPEVKKMVA